MSAEFTCLDCGAYVFDATPWTLEAPQPPRCATCRWRRLAGIPNPDLRYPRPESREARE